MEDERDMAGRVGSLVFDPTGIFDDVWLGVLRDKERLYIFGP